MWRSCLFAQVVGGCCHSNSYLTEYYLECQLADYSLISRRDYSTNSNDGTNNGSTYDTDGPAD